VAGASIVAGVEVRDIGFSIRVRPGWPSHHS
jgi:hypothetical protein